ncbi:hypothetical protein GCM10011504_52370 [Siccirubricoccus deserti]|nr:hypothetical protein GCM10011504_52370 [Siccirubricoccus deserti]
MLMEADVEGLIGAGRHERTGERLNYRSGFRNRTLDTRLAGAALMAACGGRTAAAGCAGTFLAARL